jgi:hypothetical protein
MNKIEIFLKKILLFSIYYPFIFFYSIIIRFFKFHSNFSPYYFYFSLFPNNFKIKKIKYKGTEIFVSKNKNNIAMIYKTFFIEIYKYLKGLNYPIYKISGEKITLYKSLLKNINSIQTQKDIFCRFNK